MSFRKALEVCNLPTSDEMVVRWLLWDSQGPFCIYTNQALSCVDLPKLQIEHIVPRALGGPDAYWNWVLCTEDANAEKGNRVPYAWFKQERTPGQWDDYKKRIRDRQAKLGGRKVDLLLRADAAELVGEKYTALADTAWITRLAQSVARLHFGWPLDDEPEKEKVITISGGLTARIRRKYLLDSLLGADEEAAGIRQAIDAALAELETVRGEPGLHEDEYNRRKVRRNELRQELPRLAKESDEKNRDDKRHHALDAMLLTFLPNWARDRNKQDFFRFEDIGDAPLYSEQGKQEIAIIQKEIRKLADETAPVREQIQAAKKREDAAEMQRLKDKIFPQRKRMAQCFQQLDKFKQPRNIRAVRDWFRKQIEGDGETNSPVRPRQVAWEKAPIEAFLYRRVYIVDAKHVEAKTIPAPNLALAPDPRDETRSIFDLKWLWTRIQSIAEYKSYEKKKLKSELSARLAATLINCQASNRNISIKDWQDICSADEIRALFSPKGRGKSKMLAEPSECLVKVCKVEVLPAKRYPLVELAYASGSTYVWNPTHFQEQIVKIVRKVEQLRQGRGRGRISIVPQLANPAEASPWDGFVWDTEIQTKLKTPELRQDIIQTLVPVLVPPGLEADEREEKKKIWKQAWDAFCTKHKLSKRLFLYEATATKPPRKPSTPLMGVIFEKKDKIFSAAALKKQADFVVDICLKRCLMCFADSLGQVSDEHQREILWKTFCDTARTSNKKALEDFISTNSTPAAEHWISFFEQQIGPRVLLVEQVTGKSLGEYFDLSKDGIGIFAKGGNQGYLICQNADKIEGHPIRFFESQATLKKRIFASGWKLLDAEPWRSGDLLKLSKPAGTAKKTVQPGYYFLGSISNNTTTNLNACFGGDVHQGVSLKALWHAELRRV